MYVHKNLIQFYLIIFSHWVVGLVLAWTLHAVGFTIKNFEFCNVVSCVLKLLLNRSWDQLIVKISLHESINSISNTCQSKFKFISSFYFQSKNAKSDQNSGNGQNSIKNTLIYSSPCCLKGSFILTPINKCGMSYKLEIVIYLALCVPSAVLFKLNPTIGIACALWHNLLTRQLN